MVSSYKDLEVWKKGIDLTTEIYKIVDKFPVNERYGSGIKRIRNECNEHGLIEPVFEEFSHGFRVTIYKEKLNVGVNVGVNVGINELLEYIQKHQPIKANQLAEHFPKVTQRTIERWIKQLKDEERIEFIGSPKTGGYWEIIGIRDKG